MSEQKWTPGPWRETLETVAAEICTIHCCSPRSGPEPEAQRWVYIVSDKSAWRREEEQDANARLIAAAPELYAALADIAAVFLRNGSREEYDDAFRRSGIAAFSKARGEP